MTQTLSSIQIKHIIKEIATILNDNKEFLTELDSAMGDGDLGLYLPRGFEYAANSLTEDMLPGHMLIKASSIVNSEAPSTLGTLLSFALLVAGKSAGDDSELKTETIVGMGDSVINIIIKRGKAKQGEKTILDVIIPAHEALKKAFDKSADITEAFRAALAEAKIGLDKSTNMRAVHGRPGYYGDASIGKQDGGAVVGYLIYQGIFNVLADYNI